MELIDQINSHKWLYLNRLYEEIDLELCLHISEARTEGRVETQDDATAYQPIVWDPTCRRYKITFRNYIAYSVTNESCAGFENNGQTVGNLFSLLTKTRFLDYVASSGGGIIETLGPYKHYQVVTLNQIIDVATTDDPIIELLAPTHGM